MFISRILDCPQTPIFSKHHLAHVAGFKKGRGEEKYESIKGAVGFPSVPNLISLFPLPFQCLPCRVKMIEIQCSLLWVAIFVSNVLRGWAPGFCSCEGEGGAFPQTIPFPVSRLNNHPRLDLDI